MLRICKPGPTFAVVLVSAALGAGCRGTSAPALVELDQSRHLAAEMRIQFNKASDAADRAVMADTDEASVAFAKESTDATQVVKDDAAAIAPLLRDLAYQKESGLLGDFDRCFADHQKVMGEVLALAVENTNLKAQRLSFGPARKAADELRDALAKLSPGVAAKDGRRAEQLVAQATLAVREIQVLQAPHIAEADDSAMSRIEKEMNDRRVSAAGALEELGKLAAPGTAALDDARAAFERFQKISDEIVQLSRKNTNVRSLDLALRSVPKVTATCDDELRALQEALDGEGAKATR